MHHAGTGVILGCRESNANQQTRVCTQPAASPNPVAVDGIYDCPNHEAVREISLGFRSFGHGAGDDGRGGRGEHHLEYPINVILAFGSVG